MTRGCFRPKHPANTGISCAQRRGLVTSASRDPGQLQSSLDESAHSTGRGCRIAGQPTRVAARTVTVKDRLRHREPLDQQDRHVMTERFVNLAWLSGVRLCVPLLFCYQ